MPRYQTSRHAPEGPPRAPQVQHSKLGAFALAGLAFFWGYGWIVGKIALNYCSPFTFVAIRTIPAALALLCLLPLTHRSLRPPNLRYTAAVGLLQTSCFSGFSMWALSSAGAGKTSVLIYIMPFALLLLSRMFLGETLHDLQRLAVLTALPGLVLIIAPWRLQGLLPSLLTIAAGIAWAGSAVIVKLWQQREPVDVLSLTAWQTIIGAIPLVVIALIVREGSPDWNMTFIAALAYNALLANGLGWLLWLFALHELPAGVAGFGTLAVPVIGIVSAWLQLGERPGGIEAAGMALIIAGISMNAYREATLGRAGGRRQPQFHEPGEPLTAPRPEPLEAPGGRDVRLRSDPANGRHGAAPRADPARED